MKRIIYPLFLVFFISQSYAQVSQLSLAEAIKIGLENNYDIQIENKTVEVATIKNAWGAAGLFPSINLQAAGSNTIFDNKESLNPFSIIGKTKTRQLSPSINLNWNLLNIYNISINKERLAILQQESQGNASIVISNTIQAIILGYYLAVLEKERVTQFKEQLSHSSDTYQRELVRKELGSAVTTDLLLAEGNYLTDSSNYINQLQQFNDAILNLNFLLGTDELSPSYELVDTLNASLKTWDLADLVNKMESENFDLKKQYLSQSVLTINKRLRRLDRLPSLSLGANYTLNRNRQDVSDWPENRREIRDQEGNVLRVLSVGNNSNNNIGVNFTLTFNLFNGGAINRAIKEAQTLENIGEIRIEKLKASLRRDLQKSLNQYNLRKELLSINQRRKAAAFQNLNISEEKFNNGTVNSLDFRAIQNNYLLAAIQELQSIYDLIEAETDLTRMTGGILREYQ